MEKQKHNNNIPKRKSSISREMALMIFMMILVSALIVGGISYLIYRGDTTKSFGSLAVSIAQTTAAGIDGDAFEEIMASGRKNEYWDEVHEFIERAAKNTGATFLYLLDNDYSDKVTFFADTSTPKNTNVQPFGGQNDASQFGAELFETIGTGKPTISSVYSTKEYGTLISGYYPIFNSGGKVAGVVGVDVDVEEITNQAIGFGIKTLLSILIFSISSALVAYYQLNRKIGKPIKELSSASQKLAKGDMQVSVQARSNDEIGDLANDFMHIRTTLTTLTEGIQNMIAEQSAGNTEAEIDASQFMGVYRTAAEGINHMIMQYTKDIREFLSVLSQFGQGNFEAELPQFPGQKARMNEISDQLRNNLKSVSSDIARLAHSAAEGNLTERLDINAFEGQWRTIASELNRLLDGIAKPINDSSSALGQMAQGNLSIQLTDSYKGDFAVIQNALNETASEISSYITEIREVLRQIADNNLDQSITREYVGQFTEIKDAINHIISQFNRILGEISRSSEEVAAGSGNLSEFSQQLAAEANTQTSIVNILTEMMDKINTQTSANAENAENAKAISMQSRDNAVNGNQEMDKLLQAIGQIQKSSDNISKVIKVIEDIAFQTNLLALNAAVEAARAGQHGKGFAVVADQVRGLAQRSQEAVKDTTTLIEESTARVNEGTILAQSTAEALNRIVENITEVSALVEDISASSQLQNNDIMAAGQNLAQMSQSVANNSASSEEASALSEQLAAHSYELKDMIQRFQLKA